MNATPPVLPAFIPDAGAAATATTPQASPVKSDGRATFAGTLKDVGAKNARKPVSAKAVTGESVPPIGNSTPPTQPASAAPINTAAGASMPAKAPDEQPISVAPIGAAASTPPAASLPRGEGLPKSLNAGQPISPLPVGVAAAGATSPDTGATAPQASAPAPAVSAAAPPDAPSTGIGKASAAPPAPRPILKPGLQHPVAAANAPAESDDGDAATTPSAISSTSTSTTTTTPTATTAAASVNAPSITLPSTDTSEVAAVAALAGSRNTYATAAGDGANESGDPVVGAAAVAGASLTDAALKVSAVTAAAATASAAQTSLLLSITHADKHASLIDTSTASAGADAAAGVSQLGSTATNAPGDATPAPTLRVAANVDSADFPQDLSNRVSWMVDNSINGAKLQVNPPQLGPIELRIVVSGEHAQVWMSTHSAVTRDALESSTPKLREMLGAQGFSQVSVDISQRSFQERSAHAQPYERAAAAGRTATAAVETIAASATTRNSLGAVDAYA